MPENMCIGGCGDCYCRQCLFWWSQRCPYGECYDDLRAAQNPYDKAHGGKIRKEWSDWAKPGEQAHWCRGGVCYAQASCDKFVFYTGSMVKTCLGTNVEVYQDGYIQCSLVNTVGCQWCYEQFLQKENRK